jgi:hypothetical protein
MKKLTNPAARKVPINISLELRIVDMIDERVGKKGNRSDFIENILKRSFGLDTTVRSNVYLK